MGTAFGGGDFSWCGVFLFYITFLPFDASFVGSLLSFTALAVTELFSSVRILTTKTQLKLDASEFLEKPI